MLKRKSKLRLLIFRNWKYQIEILHSVFLSFFLHTSFFPLPVFISSFFLSLFLSSSPSLTFSISATQALFPPTHSRPPLFFQSIIVLAAIHNTEGGGESGGVLLLTMSDSFVDKDLWNQNLLWPQFPFTFTLHWFQGYMFLFLRILIIQVKHLCILFVFFSLVPISFYG